MTHSILVLDRDDELLGALGRAAPHLEADMVAAHQTARAASEIATNNIKVLVAGPSILTSAGIRFLQQMHENKPDLITVLVASRERA